MKTPTEAYEFALEKIEELRQQGIKVEIIPSDAKDRPDTVKKYSRPECIPPEKWVHVRFYITDNSQRQEIGKVRNYLALCGMTFDTGGMIGRCDWELDWSFSYTGEIDEEWKDAANEVDDIISNLPNDCEEE